MKYLGESAELSDVSLNLRNKNLALVPTHSGRADRIVENLVATISRWNTSRMLKRGFRLVVSEQIVEHPLVFRSLRPTDAEILDFGGTESVLALQLSALGYRVSVLDQRRYPFSHENLRVFCGDLLDPSLSLETSFDAVVSISTIEHLGLGRYGDAVVDSADKTGVEVLWKLVKRGGRLIASVPAGRPAKQRGYRVYDESRLREVFPHATSVSWFMKETREATWMQVEASRVAELVYDEPYSFMPVQAIAFVVCEKD